MENFYDFFKNNNEQDKLVVMMYLKNPKLKIKEIAENSNKSIGEIYRILKSNEIEPNRLKTNHKKVENLAKLGWGLKEIAEFTGYTVRNIRNILKEKNDVYNK